MPRLDETHDPRRRSWVASANYHPDFPIQNLALGVFSPPGGKRRGGGPIGDQILDLAARGGSGRLGGAERPLRSGARAAAGSACPFLGASGRRGRGPAAV